MNIKRFIHDERGQDMIEYGLLGAFLSIIAVGVLINFYPLVSYPHYGMRDALSGESTDRGTGSGDKNKKFGD